LTHALIAESETKLGQIQISMIWQSTAIPNEVERDQAPEAFRQTLVDELDWDTAQYNKGKVRIQT